MLDAFVEAKEVLDQFPVGHAVFMQERLRAGKFEGGSYAYYNDRHMGCPACFYGTLAYAECLQSNDELQEFEDRVRAPYLNKYDGITELEDEVVLINEGEAVSKNQWARRLDDFLTSYIHERLSAREQVCALVEDAVLELA